MFLRAGFLFGVGFFFGACFFLACFFLACFFFGAGFFAGAFFLDGLASPYSTRGSTSVLESVLLSSSIW